MSEDIGMTKVLALIRPNAARKSPPVWRLTSPRCHFGPTAVRLSSEEFEGQSDQQCNNSNFRASRMRKGYLRRP